MVGLQAVVIVNDVIVGGINSSPTGGLADQVKVIPEGGKWNECENEGKQNEAKPEQHTGLFH